MARNAAVPPFFIPLLVQWEPPPLPHRRGTHYSRAAKALNLKALRITD